MQRKALQATSDSRADARWPLQLTTSQNMLSDRFIRMSKVLSSVDRGI
jgi:hypothetical protein